MIIKNNFNEKDVEPLKDYHSIGKGSDSLDKKFEMEKEGFIPENMDNKVIQDIINSDHEYDEDDNDDNKDKWNFFR